MAIQIQKRIKVDNQFQMVKLQLLLYLFFKELNHKDEKKFINLSDSELNCATLLALNGFKKTFFKDVKDAKIFKTEQSARNCMKKLKAAHVAVKDGKDWAINPEISIGIDKIILLDLKVGNLK